MRRLSAGLALGLVTWAAAVVAAPPAQADLAPRVLSLEAPAQVAPATAFVATGRVVDGEGDPMPDQAVIVTVDCTGTAVSEERAYVTDTDGRFEVPVTAGPCYTVRFTARAEATATHVGLFAQQETAVDRAPTVLTTTVDVGAARPGDVVEVEVRLTDADGVPLEGAEVSLDMVGDDWRTTTHVTDATGSFRVERALPYAHAWRFRSHWTGTTTLSGATSDEVPVVVERIPTTIQAAPFGTARVGEPFTVTGSIGPVERPVDILVHHPDGDDSVVTTTDAGSFAFTTSSAQHGEQTWWLRHPGTTRYDESELFLEVPVQLRPSSLTATAPATAVVGQEVSVTGRLEGPAAGSRIEVTAPDGQLTEHDTAEDGSFSLTLVPQAVGTQTWRIDYDGSHEYAPTSTEITLDASFHDVTTDISTDPRHVDTRRGVAVTVGSSEPIPEAVVQRVDRAGRSPVVVYRGPLPASFMSSAPASADFVVLPGSNATQRWDGDTAAVVAHFGVTVASDAPDGPRLAYDYASRPVFVARARGLHHPACLAFQLTTTRPSGRRDTTTSRCHAVRPRAIGSRWRAPKTLAVGVNHRVIAVFRGNVDYGRTTSRPIRFTMRDPRS